MFSVLLGLPLAIPNEKSFVLFWFSFEITRGSPKWNLNISPPINTYCIEKKGSTVNHFSTMVFQALMIIIKMETVTPDRCQWCLESAFFLNEF